MSRAELVALAAAAACVVGMMLVIAGVIVAGLFLPGVIVTGLGALLFVVAALMPTDREAGSFRTAERSPQMRRR